MDVDFIVKNFFEPNTPDSYNMGENGKAVFEYLANEEVGTNTNTITGDFDSDNLYFYEVKGNRQENYVLKYKGEYLTVYELKSNGKVGKEVDSWGGDSTGNPLPWTESGRDKDKKDIQELFEMLGITAI